MEKTMSYLERMDVPDVRGLEPTDTQRGEATQLADDADRAELRRALLVYGMAGAHGADQARSGAGDIHG
jgi:hypothetical protein